MAPVTAPGAGRSRGGSTTPVPRWPSWPKTIRWRAAGIVFDLAHPVADAGDDVAAGPIMNLVVESWPNHYMALYHAGISDSALGHRDRARRHLTAFLDLYKQDDGFTRKAREELAKLR